MGDTTQRRSADSSAVRCIHEPDRAPPARRPRLCRREPHAPPSTLVATGGLAGQSASRFPPLVFRHDPPHGPHATTARAEGGGYPLPPCPPPSACGRWLLLYLRERAPATLGRRQNWSSTVEYLIGLCEAGTGPAGARVGGAEKRSPPGRARSALRRLTRRPCLSGATEGSAASWAAGQEGEHRRGVGAKRRPPPPRAPAGPLPASARGTSNTRRGSPKRPRQIAAIANSKRAGLDLSRQSSSAAQPPRRPDTRSTSAIPESPAAQPVNRPTPPPRKTSSSINSIVERSPVGPCGWPQISEQP